MNNEIVVCLCVPILLFGWLFVCACAYINVYPCLVKPVPHLTPPANVLPFLEESQRRTERQNIRYRMPSAYQQTGWHLAVVKLGEYLCSFTIFFNFHVWERRALCVCKSTRVLLVVWFLYPVVRARSSKFISASAGLHYHTALPSFLITHTCKKLLYPNSNNCLCLRQFQTAESQQHTQARRFMWVSDSSVRKVLSAHPCVYFRCPGISIKIRQITEWIKIWMLCFRGNFSQQDSSKLIIS